MKVPSNTPKEFHTLVQITGMLRAVPAALGFSQRRIEEMRRMNNIKPFGVWEVD